MFTRVECATAILKVKSEHFLKTSSTLNKNTSTWFCSQTFCATTATPGMDGLTLWLHKVCPLDFYTPCFIAPLLLPNAQWKLDSWTPPGSSWTLDASAVGGLKSTSSKVLLEISCVSWCYNLVTSLRRYVWLNENLHCSQSCNNIRMNYVRSLLHCTSSIISTYIVYNSHHELESITFSVGKS